VSLEQFPAKRISLRVAKLRQNKNVALVSDSTGSETALEQFPAKQISRRVAKLRQNKNVALVSDSTGSETALEHFPAKRSRFDGPTRASTRH
jgi:hypothetical protein